MRNHLAALERYFTIITWDQRGAGKAYPALDPVGTLAVESMVADTLAVTDHLRGQFGQDRIYLLGQCRGSILGVLASGPRRRSTPHSSGSARWSARFPPTPPSTRTRSGGPHRPANRICTGD